MSFGSGFRRLIAGISLASIVTACVPDTTLSYVFDGKGNILDKPVAIGEANGFYVKINGGTPEDFSNPIGEITTPIKKGGNTLQVAAYNRWGKDRTPATRFFLCPSEEEITQKIDEILTKNGYQLIEDSWKLSPKFFLKKAPFSLGDFDCIVDYWIKTEKEEVVVNLGYEGLEALAIKEQNLTDYAIKNLALYLSTEEKMAEAFKKFMGFE